MIKSSFDDKDNGRTWNKVFSKHFTVGISSTTVTHGGNGQLLDFAKDIPQHRIVLATQVGNDVFMIC